MPTVRLRPTLTVAPGEPDPPEREREEFWIDALAPSAKSEQRNRSFVHVHLYITPLTSTCNLIIKLFKDSTNVLYVP